MPHKANAACRHHIPRAKRRVTNWAEYDAALRQRGSLTVWFSEEAIAGWKASPRTTPGGQPLFSVGVFMGDGAYDSADVYAAVEERHPDALVIVPPRAGAVASSQTSPTQRDGHIRNIAARGRRGWQAASGYNRRALVEAQIGRYKRVIGNALRSHTEEARRAEVAIADHVLNRMNDLGRPKSVRVS